MLRNLTTYLILFLFLFASKGILAQSQKQLIKWADENAKLGDYYGASIYYKKAMEMDSADIHLLYKYATSLRKYNNYDGASYYYTKITDKDKGGRIYKDAWFWLAIMQKYNGNYRGSAKTWKKVASLYKRDKKGYEYLKAKQERGSVGFAMRTKNDSLQGCSITHLGKGVNTTDSEFSAFVNGNKMYYSTLRIEPGIGNELEVYKPEEYKIKIYEAENPENWTTKEAIDTLINSSEFHAANGCYSSDGSKFYFTRCDTLTDCAIFVSNYSKGKWSKAVPLPKKVNQPNTNNTQPNIANINGKEILFFVSNRDGGSGSLDIWHCDVLDGNTYSTPKNAGDKINTPDPDVTPFYDAKEGILYFSSSWHQGYGGFDVFKAKGKPGKFYVPENMKAPINSSWNDFYFTLNKEGEKGFITSNRKGVFYKKGPTCCNDIFELTFEKEEEQEDKKIETLDDLNKYLPVTLYFHNDRPGPRSYDTVVPISYMVAYDRYKDLQPKYRTEYSKGLKEEQAIEAQLDIDDFFTHYVDKGVSDLELFSKLLLEELQKGEKIEVTVKGFASPLAKTEYNVNLTRRRISSLVNYLKEYGTGEFVPYINHTAPNGGELTFEKIPFGEYTASSSVSDDYYDQRNSIYNRSAALERKIEIQTVRKANPSDSIYAEMNVGMSTYDFGKVTRGDTLLHSFKITNSGNKDLTLRRVVTSCDCSVVEFSEDPIPPGETTEIKVRVDTGNMKGKQVKSITVLADAFPTTKRLVITAEVFDKQ